MACSSLSRAKGSDPVSTLMPGRMPLASSIFGNGAVGRGLPIVSS